MEENGRIAMTENGIEYVGPVTVTVSKGEYTKLIKIAERVTVLERIVERNEYIPVEEIRAILDFKRLGRSEVKKAQGEGL